ncbi:MAG: porin, partial [Pyrinomonadaceae bacterium]
DMVKYKGNWHDFTVNLSYAMGGVAGHNSYGDQTGAAINYGENGPFSVSVAYLQSSDPKNGSKGKAWSLGGGYTLDQTRFSFGYITNRLDPSFSSFGIYSAAALKAIKYTDFASRQMFFGGVSQTFGRIYLSANFWRTLQTGKTSAQNGNATQWEIIADYSLSRRTSVYAELDHSQYSGGLIGAQLQDAKGMPLPNTTHQLGAMVGVRHRF